MLKEKTMKKLFVMVLVLILLVAMIVQVGLASAAPPPLHNHRPTQVNGTLEIVSWPIEDAIIVPGPNPGDLISSNNVLTCQMHGDLEGTYTMTLTYRYNLFATPYTMSGTETFVGTLMGFPVSYTSEQSGSGEFAAPLAAGVFAGTESWVSTIVSAETPLSHLRGQINVNGVYDLTVIPEVQEYTYNGELVWQPGNKN